MWLDLRVLSVTTWTCVSFLVLCITRHPCLTSEEPTVPDLNQSYPTCVWWGPSDTSIRAFSHGREQRGSSASTSSALAHLLSERYPHPIVAEWCQLKLSTENPIDSTKTLQWVPSWTTTATVVVIREWVRKDRQQLSPIRIQKMLMKSESAPPQENCWKLNEHAHFWWQQMGFCIALCADKVWWQSSFAKIIYCAITNPRNCGWGQFLTKNHLDWNQSTSSLHFTH